MQLQAGDTWVPEEKLPPAVIPLSEAADEVKPLLEFNPPSAEKSPIFAPLPKAGGPRVVQSAPERISKPAPAGGGTPAKPNTPSGNFSRRGFVATNGGRVDDSYNIGKNIGSGAYGTVQEGTDKATGAVRAIKSINKKLVGDADRLANELDIMKSLDHPHIIKLFETFEDARFIYLVMECCVGGELFDKIVDTDGGFSEVQAAKMIRQVISAIFYMHKNLIAHRDIKPENCLLRNDVMEDLDLVLIDFGLSSRFSPGGEAMKTRACTPFYVAPEVLGGFYNEKCDCWSLGVMMYVLLCGGPPFYGQTDQEVLNKVQKGDFDYDMPVWNEISRDAIDLIDNLLVVNPRKRFTAEQAFNHYWIQNLAPNASGAILSREALSNFSAFRQQNKFMKAALTVIAQQVDETAIANLKEMFKSLDKDGDGTLTLEEMREGLAKSNVEVPVNLEEIMKAVDSDGSGEIDYTEFLAATIDRKKYTQEDVCWAAFRVFDLDGNGKITKDELATVFSGGGVTKLEETFGLEREEIEKLIEEVDQDGDGEIDFEEFMAMMKRGDQLKKTGEANK